MGILVRSCETGVWCVAQIIQLVILQNIYFAEHLGGSKHQIQNEGMMPRALMVPVIK